MNEKEALYWKGMYERNAYPPLLSQADKIKYALGYLEGLAHERKRAEGLVVAIKRRIGRHNQGCNCFAREKEALAEYQKKI